MSSDAEIQRRWNEEALARAWSELGALTRDEVTAAGFSPLDALEVDGRFPSFQFEEGRRDTMRRIRDALDGVLGPRSTLLWLTGSSGYLDGARPVDELDAHPDEVVAAARYQASLGED